MINHQDPLITVIFTVASADPDPDPDPDCSDGCCPPERLLRVTLLRIGLGPCAGFKNPPICPSSVDIAIVGGAPGTPDVKI